MASAELVLYQEEFQRLDGALKKLRQEANARAIFLIDKNGTIRYKHIGPVTVEALKTKILPLAEELARG